MFVYLKLQCFFLTRSDKLIIKHRKESVGDKERPKNTNQPEMTEELLLLILVISLLISRVVRDKSLLPYLSAVSLAAPIGFNS